MTTTEHEKQPSLVGLSRSGHNAILHWLKVQANVHCLNRENMWVEKAVEEAKSRNSFVILVLRDIYNWLASRIALSARGYPDPRTAIDKLQHGSHPDKWIDHALACLDPPSQFYAILYNRWFSEHSYREKIAIDLGFRKTCPCCGYALVDDGIEHVPTGGQGSSFDRLEYNGRAQEMRVLERWKHYQDDPRYWSLISLEMHELNRRIFGWQLL